MYIYHYIPFLLVKSPLYPDLPRSSQIYPGIDQISSQDILIMIPTISLYSQIEGLRVLLSLLIDHHIS
jgi:hypothetical protein